MSTLKAGHLALPKYMCSTSHEVSCGNRIRCIIQHACAIMALVVNKPYVTHERSYGRLCADFTCTFRHGFSIFYFGNLEEAFVRTKKTGVQNRGAFRAAIIPNSDSLEGVC